MKPLIIATCHQKGGTGKSTTAYYLGIHLAAAGHQVLWIDADPHGGLTKLTRPSRSLNGQHLGHVLGGAMNPSASLRSAARDTEEGAQIVVSDLELVNVAAGLQARNLGRVEALQRAIVADGQYWDFVIIDCPPAADVLAINALWAADWVIIPCTPEPLAIEQLVQIRDVIGQVERATGRPIHQELIATMVDTRNGQHQRGLGTLIAWGAQVIIPRRNGVFAGEELHNAYAPLAERVLAAFGEEALNA